MTGINYRAYSTLWPIKSAWEAVGASDHAPWTGWEGAGRGSVPPSGLECHNRGARGKWGGSSGGGVAGALGTDQGS